MLGLSFTEILVIAIVALLAVGPQKLPGLLRTLGMWARKIRIMSTEMRAQSGIDEILKAEGLHGGITELRSLMRGQANLITSAVTTLPAPRKPIEAAPAPPPPEAEPPPPAPAEPEPAEEDPYANLDVDTVLESPPEGPDAYGAIPDDLLDDGTSEPEPELEPEPVPAPLAAAPLPTEAEPAQTEPEPVPLAATPEAAPPTAEAPPNAEARPPEPEVASAPLTAEPPAPEAQTTSHER